MTIEAGEQTIVRQFEPILNYECGVGEVNEIVFSDPIILNRIVDEPSEKCDIRSGSDLEEEISLRRRPGKARINHDHFGVAVQLSFNRPLETTRVVLGRIATHDQHHVCILDVDPAVGHCAASEGGPQTGDRRTVSNPGLRFEIADPQAAHCLDREKIQFIRISAAASPADSLQSIDGITVLIFVDERLVSRLFCPARNLIDRIVPGDVIPVIRTRAPHLWLKQATITDNVLFERSTLGTKRPTINRMIGIALDVDNLRYRVLCFVAERVDDYATAN